MKSYQAISEEAGTTVEVVRGIAKTIKRDEPGAWLTKDGKACKTKAQAIVEAARAKRDAQEAARLDMCRQARDVMAANGVEIPADPDETMRIAERLQNLAAAKHVGMERLDADDVATLIACSYGSGATARATCSRLTGTRTAHASTWRCPKP